jgi:hypothetical protein
VASGSIATVFALDGVVIKIIGDAAHADVEVAACILDAVAHLLRDTSRRPGEALILSVIASDLRRQLDMRFEYQALIEAGRTGARGVRIPVAYDANERVLAMSWIPVEHALTALSASRIFSAIEWRLFSGALFHSDLHIGNACQVKDSEDVAILDWGSAQSTHGVNHRGLFRSSIYCCPRMLIGCIFPDAGEELIASAVRGCRDPEATPEDVTFKAILALANSGQECSVEALRVFIGIGHVAQLYATCGFEPIRYDGDDKALALRRRLFAVARLGAMTGPDGDLWPAACEMFQELRDFQDAEPFDEVVRELSDSLDTHELIRERGLWAPRMRQALARLAQ